MSSSFETSWTSRTLKMACWAPASAVRPRRSTTGVGRQGAARAVGRDGDLRQERPLDAVVVTADRFAVASQHAELVAQLVGVGAEDVAGVGVLGHQLERASLAAATDEDGRVRSRERLRAVQQVAGLVVPTLEG